MQGIARAAESAGVQAVAAPYWECYRLGFLTGRQLACVPYDGPVRDGAALQRWRRQQAFAVILPTEQVQSVLVPRDPALQADRVDASPIERWTLVVVAPRSPGGWEERKALWSDRLAKIADERADCFSGWPALR